jgi:hypothetical protein
MWNAGDGCEYWNTAKASSLKNRRPNPEPVEKNLPTMHAFSKDCHDLVLKLLGIFSEQLGKERDFFAKRHRWEAEAGDMIRMIRYPPMPEDPERALMVSPAQSRSLSTSNRFDYRPDTQTLAPSPYSSINPSAVFKFSTDTTGNGSLSDPFQAESS